MSFTGDLQAFQRLFEQRERDNFVDCATEVQRSMTEGSEITGAPGQPVDEGFLIGSWIPEFLSDRVWQTTTNAEYAPGIEDGVGPHGAITLRSAVGGFHSRKLTIAGWFRIVEVVGARHGFTLRHSLDTRRRP